jgi:hypothetical protein
MQRAQTGGNCQNTVQASPAANALPAANAQRVSYDQRAVNDANSQGTQAAENDHNPEQSTADESLTMSGLAMGRFDDDQADPYE